jgi:hypothetical protein
MKQVLDKLAKVTGISPEEVGRIFDDVKENKRKLDACELHDFYATGEGVRSDFLCRRCDGRISRRDHMWYQIGIRHGKKDKSPTT